MLLPLRPFSDTAQDVGSPAVALEVAQPKLDRVLSGIGCNLVQNGFTGKTAGELAGSAEIARPERNRFRLYPRNFFRDDFRVFESIHLTAALISVPRARRL